MKILKTSFKEVFIFCRNTPKRGLQNIIKVIQFYGKVNGAI